MNSELENSTEFVPFVPVKRSYWTLGTVGTTGTTGTLGTVGILGTTGTLGTVGILGTVGTTGTTGTVGILRVIFFLSNLKLAFNDSTLRCRIRMMMRVWAKQTGVSLNEGEGETHRHLLAVRVRPKCTYKAFLLIGSVVNSYCGLWVTATSVNDPFVAGCISWWVRQACVEILAMIMRRKMMFLSYVWSLSHKLFRLTTLVGRRAMKTRLFQLRKLVLVFKPVESVMHILFILSISWSMLMLAVALLMPPLKRLTTMTARTEIHGSRWNPWTFDKLDCHFDDQSPAMHRISWKLRVPHNCSQQAF